MPNSPTPSCLFTQIESAGIICLLFGNFVGELSVLKVSVDDAVVNVYIKYIFKWQQRPKQRQQQQQQQIMSTTENGRENKWPSAADLMDHLHKARLAIDFTYSNFISFVHRIL